MKVELSTHEQKQLDAAIKRNPIRKWFAARETMKFEVGDVLVKHIKHYDYQTSTHTWKVENINSDTKMAQRYVYIHEDEVGIGYFKQLKVSTGTLGKELWCATDFDFDSTKFEVDPEYAEHVLLDAEFDIKQVHKRSLVQRKIITKMNRKIGIKPKTVKEFNDFFDKLKDKDVFYTSYDYTGRNIYSHTIEALSKVPISELNSSTPWWWRRWKEKNDASRIDAAETYKMSYKDQYGIQSRFVMEWEDHVFYTVQPAQEEKK